MCHLNIYQDNADLKDFLNSKVLQYNNPEFIDSDPIQIPHRFSGREDIEISGFLTATIAWGKREYIIKNSSKMMALMDDSPYDFVINHSTKDLERLSGFCHRTFNGEDFKYFVKGLRHLYRKFETLETLFVRYATNDSLQDAISHFKRHFFEISHLKRNEKHISNTAKGSAAKRINMFLRWMVRNDSHGVDFGIWKRLSPKQLSCPLDVHSGRVARQLSLIKRKQNDSKTVRELDNALRKLDPDDPVKYDFALFGLGIFEKF